MWRRATQGGRADAFLHRGLASLLGDFLQHVQRRGAAHRPGAHERAYRGRVCDPASGYAFGSSGPIRSGTPAHPLRRSSGRDRTSRCLWVRRRALRGKKVPKRGRFLWLEPPTFEGSLTVLHIAQAPDPESRAGKAQDYVEQTWELWYSKHGRTISAWYDAFVVPDGL